jgi:murein DD-endopeptidase MepM/ murein hydrolase activator NlpD
MGRFGVNFIVMAGMLLSGCIPANADVARRKAPQLAEPELETLYDEAPVWEARPVRPSAVNQLVTSHIVQPGETLSAIAVKNGVPLSEIIAANSLEAPYIIRPGQKLALPGGRFHTVQAGESGIAIARAYELPWQDIVALNQLLPPFTLKIGQRLKLPSASEERPAPQDIEARAAAFKLDIEDIITGGEPAGEVQIATNLPPVAPPKPLAPTIAVGEPRRFSGQFIWPVDGPILARFGGVGAAERNDGVEIGATPGTPIRAASDGVVAFVGNGVRNYGGVILLRHGDGWITAYGRASEAAVTRGQTVRKGQIIGKTGDFGLTSAPQLHFELRRGSTPVDPVKHLPPKT